MMNKINKLFQEKEKDILNIYFTAGFPLLNDTTTIIQSLEKNGVDLIEIGMPYSDPLADGPTIQESGSKAIENGMTLPILFDQLKSIKEKVNTPLILMGYFNQVMQYGEERFVTDCVAAGVSGVILPDLPLYEFEEKYQDLFAQNNLGISFLITPQTTDERIRKIDELSSGFIYMVSSASITGAKRGISDQQIDYFERINQMELSTPRLIGFGISDHDSFSKACQYARGAIIGSAFIRALEARHDVNVVTEDFVNMVRGKKEVDV